MIFNDVVEWYEEIIEKGAFLEVFKDELTQISIAYKNASLNILTANYTNTLDANNLHGYKGNVISAIDGLNLIITRINFMKLGKTISMLESLKDSCKGANETLINLINTLETCSEITYNYMNLSQGKRFPNDSNKLMYSIDKTINEIDNIIFIANYLKTINHAIQKDYEKEEAILEIRLYRETMTMLEIGSYMQTINNIYERACSILNVSASEYELVPIKMESGSWYEKVLGHESVIKFLQGLLDRAIGFIYRNYTNEGKLKEGATNKINVLKDTIELTELCKQHGIDTEVATEILEDNLNVLCADIYKLTTGNSKIAIGGKVYDASKGLSQALLENKNTNYLESAKEE